MRHNTRYQILDMLCFEVAVPMTITVSAKTRNLFPASVRRKAGLKLGTELEVRVSGGIITMLPSLPTAAGEYTPAQRRAIKDEVAEARKGPYHGPFTSGDELAAYLKVYKRARATKTKRSG